jgi:hypothetical protein
MRTAAMNQQKAALVWPRRLARPDQVMDPAARYRHELRLARAGNGPPKPIRRRRTDRREIGWYGFAAQRGCTRIYCICPATDRPISYRSKDPAHSVALRQQHNFAVRGAGGMLEALPVLCWNYFGRGDRRDEPFEIARPCATPQSCRPARLVDRVAALGRACSSQAQSGNSR